MQKNGVFKNYSFIFSKLAKYDGVVFVYLVAMTVSNVVKPLVLVFLPKLALEEITKPDWDWRRLLTTLIFLLVLWVVCEIISTFCETRIDIKLMGFRQNILLEAGKKSMSMPFSETENPETLNKLFMARMAVSNSIMGVQPYVRHLFNFFPIVIYLAVSLIYLLQLDFWIFIAYLALAPVVYFSNRHYDKSVLKTAEDTTSISRKKTYLFNQVMCDFAYGKEIRLSKMKVYLAGQLDAANKELLLYNKKLQNKKTLALLISGFGDHAIEIFFYLYLASLVFTEKIGLSDFGFYMALVIGFSKYISSVFEIIAKISADNSHINNFRSFLSIDYTDHDGDIQMNDDFVFESLQFQNVSFKYPGQEQLVLKNLNLSIKGNQRIALVGKNGAGKSTFIKLLCRMYEPSEGEILLNGVNINKYSFDSYMKLISVVFQDIHMYPFTIEENIALANDIDDQKVKNAIDTIGLSGKIKKIPLGLKTFPYKGINDNSIELSGGEQQKLAIARAIYKNSPIFVLDEPTGAMDPFSEIAFYEDFSKVSEGKLSFFISHRIASTAFCDYIYVFDNGGVIEAGRKDELLKNNALYAEMYHLQAALYKPKNTEGMVGHDGN